MAWNSSGHHVPLDFGFPTQLAIRNAGSPRWHAKPAKMPQHSAFQDDSCCSYAKIEWWMHRCFARYALRFNVTPSLKVCHLPVGIFLGRCGVLATQLYIIVGYGLTQVLLRGPSGSTDAHGWAASTALGLVGGLALWSHCGAVFRDPGFLPQNVPAVSGTAMPNAEDVEPVYHQSETPLPPEVLRKYLLVSPPDTQSVLKEAWCGTCRCLKMYRSHHCSVCRRCVARMDHHCPWINNCVGVRNLKAFLLFLSYMTVFCYALALKIFTSLPRICVFVVTHEAVRGSMGLNPVLDASLGRPKDVMGPLATAVETGTCLDIRAWCVVSLIGVCFGGFIIGTFTLVLFLEQLSRLKRDLTYIEMRKLAVQKKSSSKSPGLRLHLPRGTLLKNAQTLVDPKPSWTWCFPIDRPERLRGLDTVLGKNKNGGHFA